MAFDPPRPLGIEYATLDLRRASTHATDQFLHELRRELDQQVALLLSADPATVHVAQGAANALLRLHTRMSQAEPAVEKYEADQRKAQERKK